jgi:hypothetical protein
MKKILYVLMLTFSVLAESKLDLRTVAERTNWKKTGRSEETRYLCHGFQKQFPKRVKCRSYGRTPEGRDLLYLEVGDERSPVVWVQAGIHAGEIDGKDAVFWLLRQILQGELKSDPLKGLRLIFIPIVNLDGHERFGKWNRPNQIGPEEMGWRTNAQNLNLNRDFVKVDAPEMHALLKLWGKMNPVLSLDLHVTDGAQFQPEVGLIVLPVQNHGSSSLHHAGTQFETLLVEKLKARGRWALPFYPNFEIEDRPMTGFSRYVSTARFSQGYWFNRNRLGMLVETHSWKDYATRVKTHYDTVLSSLELAQVSAKDWMLAEKGLDQVNLAGQKIELEFKHTDKFSMIEFGGYKFKIEKSQVSGIDVIQYFPHEPEVWKVPFYEELKSTLTVQAPKSGYYVPVSEVDWISSKLKVHGINYEILNKSQAGKFEVFRADKTEFSKESFEGHQGLTLEGTWKEEIASLREGSMFIPIHQARGRLVLQIFEPLAKDSYLAWGFFNRRFEHKEYMENYVTEDVAKEMLLNPQIKEEFEAKLKSDEKFAKNPSMRLQFFYKKHPSWDNQFNRYPILKR